MDTYKSTIITSGESYWQSTEREKMNKIIIIVFIMCTVIFSRIHVSVGRSTQDHLSHKFVSMLIEEILQTPELKYVMYSGQEKGFRLVIVSIELPDNFLLFGVSYLLCKEPHPMHITTDIGVCKSKTIKETVEYIVKRIKELDDILNTRGKEI